MRISKTISTRLFPQFTQARLFIIMFIQHLSGRQIEVFLSDMHASFTKGVHAGLGTDALQLGAGATVHLLGDLGEVDATREIHAATMDAENVGSGFDSV